MKVLDYLCRIQEIVASKSTRESIVMIFMIKVIGKSIIIVPSLYDTDHFYILYFIGIVALVLGSRDA